MFHGGRLKREGISELCELHIDAEQVTGHLANLDRRIVEGETRLRALQSEVDRLRGRRDVWQMLADELAQRAE
jgi:hypothetical protein